MSTLRDVIVQRVESVAPPPGDLARVVRSGTRLRRRRRGVRLGAGLGVAVVVGAVALQVTGDTEGRRGDVARDPAATVLGPMDFSDGLRAYADPGNEIHLGGRTFSAKALEFLDTDAAATPAGVVFYDAGRPMLLDEKGETTPLVEGPVDDVAGFHPTAKVDSHGQRVAFATLRGQVATVTVRSLRSGQDLGSVAFPCGTCEDLVIDALDDGVVFLRRSEGTSTWAVGDDSFEPFAPPQTRVADVRAGVVLYDGPAPRPAPATAGDWRLVAGAIDSTLTFDGMHVLGWSSELEPTTVGAAPIRLERGPVGGAAPGFWAFDTDGSVLVAEMVPTDAEVLVTGEIDYTVYDCEIPSGSCTELGPLTPTGGDPMFIGADM